MKVILMLFHFIGKKKLTVGLAGYYQHKIEAFTPQEAVDASLMMAKKMGTKEVRYWVIWAEWPNRALGNKEVADQIAQYFDTLWKHELSTDVSILK